MRTLTHLLQPEPNGRHTVGYFVTPVFVTDRNGREIAGFRSARKPGKAIVSGELALIAGDTITVGKVRVVS